MATLLLKKSYQLKNFKEVKFKDLWNAHGVFTTMRVIGPPLKILFYKEHINNLLKSLKVYVIKNKNLKNKINYLISLNLNKNKKYDHLFRVALNKSIISISLRKRPKVNKKFSLKLINYKRVDPKHKNLKYKKILGLLKKMDITKLIHIRDDGSVKLGNRVACDGGLLESEDFHIVTHAHKDHYKPQSVKETWRKHHKKVYLSDLTMQLADIYELSLIDNHGKREILEFNEPLIDENIEIKIIENGHILGSSQVQVIEEGVGRFGYSGDFCSQIEEFIDVDYLVLDSTYSGKTSNRTWKFT